MPIYPIDASKEDGDPQIEDHPAHHNDLADAVNDHQTRLSAVEEALVPVVSGDPVPGNTKFVLSKKTGAALDTEWRAVVEVPVPEASDEDKYLRATGPGTFTWDAVDGPSSTKLLPNTGGHSGKWLFNNSGTPQWKALNEMIAVPNLGSEDEVLTTVRNDGVLELSWEAPQGVLPDSTSSDDGKILIVNPTTHEASWEVDPAGIDEDYVIGWSGTVPAWKRPSINHISTSDPSDATGLDGDVWLKYTP